jgi:hypothetical protein
MTVHADAGAAVLKSLLEEPSSGLEKDVRALAVAIEQLDPASGAIPGAAAPISRLRAYYSGLAERIKGIDTFEAGAAKRQALSGLRQMDAGLAALAGVIAQNGPASGQAELERGLRQMEQAALRLEQAASAID